MAITRVQYATAAASSGSTSLSCTISSTTAGNLLVAVVAVGSTASTGGCSTPAGWSLAVGPVGTEAANDVQLYIFYKVDTAGGTTSVTFTDSQSSGITIQVWEWSTTNAWDANPLDVSSSSANQPATTSPVSGTTSTTTQGEELWIAGLTTHYATGETYSSPTNGFTAEAVATAGSACYYSPSTGAFYNIASTTGAASTGATAGTSKPFAGAIATFKDSPFKVVQTVHTDGSTGTSCHTTLASTAAGNLLVALVTAAKNPGAVTFTAPTNWVQDGTTQDNTLYVEESSAVFYYPNNPGGITSVSFTMSTAPSSWTCTILEISGAATSSVTDGFQAAIVGATGRTTGNLTTTANGDFILGFAVIDAANSGSSTVTEAAGFTSDVTYNDTAGWFTIHVGYQTQALAAAIAYAPTFLAGDDATLYIIAFKVAVAGPVNGSATVHALAGILGGINGSSALPGSISAASALPGGISGSGNAGGGITGQGEIQASSQALANETFQSEGSFGTGISAQAGVSSSQAGQAGVTTGQSGNGATGLGLSGQGNVNSSSAATPSLTISGLAGFIQGLAGQGIIPVVAGFVGSISNGVATLLAQAGILGGLSGQSGVNSGISGQGEVNGSPGSLNQATATGVGSVQPNLLAGIAKVIASSIAAVYGTITGEAGLGSGQSGSGSVQAASAATPGLTVKGAGAFTANLIAGIANLIFTPSALNGTAILLGIAGLLGGMSGQGEVEASSTALSGVAFTGLAGFIMGLAGQALMPAIDIATHGLSTLLANAGLLGGMSGNGNVYGSTVSLNQATVTGAGNVQPNFLAGIAKIIASSAAAVHSTILSGAGVSTGQSGSGNIEGVPSATPRLSLQGAGALASGLISGVSDIMSSGFLGKFPPFSMLATVKARLTQVFSLSRVLSLAFTHQGNLTLTFLELPVAQPNSTITVTSTATDINGNPVSNMATVNVTVTFPDASTQNFTLSSGVTNAGSGKYTITYTTKAPGRCLEDWLMIDPTGNQTEYHNVTPVGF